MACRAPNQRRWQPCGNWQCRPWPRATRATMPAAPHAAPMPCHAVPRQSVLCNAVQNGAAQRNATRGLAMQYHAMPRRVTQFHVALRHAIPSNSMLCRADQSGKRLQNRTRRSSSWAVPPRASHRAVWTALLPARWRDGLMPGRKRGGTGAPDGSSGAQRK